MSRIGCFSAASVLEPSASLHLLIWTAHIMTRWWVTWWFGLAVAHLMTLVVGLHDFGFSCPCGSVHTRWLLAWVTHCVGTRRRTSHDPLGGLHDFGFDRPFLKFTSQLLPLVVSLAPHHLLIWTAHIMTQWRVTWWFGFGCRTLHDPSGWVTCLRLQLSSRIHAHTVAPGVSYTLCRHLSLHISWPYGWVT